MENEVQGLRWEYSYVNNNIGGKWLGGESREMKEKENDWEGEAEDKEKKGNEKEDVGMAFPA